MAASKFITALEKIARALTQTECVGAWHQNGRKDDQMPQHFEQNTTGVRPTRPPLWTTRSSTRVSDGLIGERLK